MLGYEARLLGLVFLISLGCKPKGGARLKSIDNLVSDGAINANRCGPETITFDQAGRDMLVANNIVDGGELTETILKTMGALPKPMLSFLTIQGGKVIMVDELPQVCVNPTAEQTAAGAPSAADVAKFREGNQPAKSCWTKLANQPLAIYILKDAEGLNIRHSLLRTMAYFYAGPLANALKANFAQLVAPFEKNITDLGNVFYYIMVRQPQFAASPALQNLAGIYQSNQRFFHQMVFAEVVDSVYCNPQTYIALAAPTSPYRAVFDIFAKKEKPAEGLANELGMPWFPLDILENPTKYVGPATSN